MALVAVSRPADAGAGSSNGVWILGYGGDQSSGIVVGALGPTRRSANESEYIGCQVWGFPGFRSGYCEALSAAGTYRLCFTGDASLLDVMSTIGPASEITFEWQDWTTCSFVVVSNGSRSL
ncbi:MAG TPA: hypothetical protein VG755_43900 [Nannocystaceae bacterium]|nr:hypothetical protein [Nannocystaceae bacterium]